MITTHFKDIQVEILKEISLSKNTIKVAVAWLTNAELFDALVAKCKEKIKVELLIVNDSINVKKFGLDFNTFINEGGHLYFGSNETLMHHKFCIIDSKVIINGSYNWTYWAETKNAENVIVFNKEYSVVRSFEEEFSKLISNKHQILSVDLDTLELNLDDERLLNTKNVNVNEYLIRAFDLFLKGKIDLSIAIFNEVNGLDSSKFNKILAEGIANDDPTIKNIYKEITNSIIVHVESLTYTEFCTKVLEYINCGNYLMAIILAKICVNRFPGRFSIHVYNGDARAFLHDKEGSLIEYNLALNYNHILGSKIIYFEKAYSYSFFPKAEIYRKLGDGEKVIEILKDALVFYRKINSKIGVKCAENYLKQIENNETIVLIK